MAAAGPVPALPPAPAHKAPAHHRQRHSLPHPHVHPGLRKAAPLPGAPGAPIPGVATFRATAPATPPSPPNYLGDGKFTYNGHIYKVSLYSGDTIIDEKDVAPDKREEWRATAKKVVEALSQAEFLPGAGALTQTEAVDVNFTTLQYKEKKTGEQQFEKDFKDIPAANRQKGNQSDLPLIQTGISSVAEDFAKFQEIKRKESEDKTYADKMVLGSSSQFDYSDANQHINRGDGKIACTNISLVAASTMKNKKGPLTQQEIQTILRDGITDRKTYNHAHPAQGKIFLNTEEVITSKGADKFFPLTTSSDTPRTEYKEEIQLDMAPTATRPLIPGKENEYYVKCFTEFVTQLDENAKKLPQVGDKLSGIITLQGYSYAIAVTKKADGKTEIEFFDSHGIPASGNKAYYISFNGNNPAKEFITFFTTKLHHKYLAQEDSAASGSAEPSKELVENEIAQFKAYYNRDPSDAEIREMKEVYTGATKKDLTGKFITFMPIMPKTPSEAPVSLASGTATVQNNPPRPSNYRNLWGYLPG